ncbi:MAG: preprotein translocase subunit YajC [Bacteroidetes bacterium]|nr:preprotein translocase subunit YajC [Bacteroidota bacterium]
MSQILLMAPPQQGQGGGEIWSTLLMFGMIILIFYFMILRPQSKRQKEKQKLIESIKKGDKVVTSGGLHGIVAGTDEKTVLVEIADKVKVTFEKSSIAIVNKAGQIDKA